MTTSEAVALYRAEKHLAWERGTDLTTPQPIPECHHRRAGVPEPRGFATIGAFRNDAFVVGRR